ncbi:MAG: universal stress protein [Planctomycetes bacterium]|nr:universal stress protein [Planctomycetota bacterium]
MYRSILVPLDGSAFGEHALLQASSIARRAEARLDLMHVHPPLEPAYTEFVLIDTDWEKRVRDQERQYLEETALRVREAIPSTVVSTVHKDGFVANAIREHVALAAPDLVVLTTHARGAMGRFWLGSVADELVRTLAVPILLVRPAQEPVDLKREQPFKNVVIPLDGSALAEQMIEPAIALGKLYAAKIHLVRVVKPVMSSIVPMGMATMNDLAGHITGSIEKAQKQVLADAESYLNKMAANLRAGNLHVTTTVELEVQPGVGILNAAKVRGADLIALATHGRRGLSRMFLGSVADKVLRGAAVPVLLQKPKG